MASGSCVTVLGFKAWPMRVEYPLKIRNPLIQIGDSRDKQPEHPGNNCGEAEQKPSLYIVHYGTTN